MRKTPLKISPHRVWILFKKELTQLSRDPLVLLVFLSAVTVQLVLFGYSADSKVAHIPLVYVDQDRTSASRRLLQALSPGGFFSLKYPLENTAALKAALSQGRAEVGLVIPKNFFKDVQDGKSVGLEIYLDGTRSTTAILSKGYLQRFIQNYFAQNAGGQAGRFRAPEIRVDTALLHNPELKGSWFMIPGVIGAILALILTPMAAASFARERESGTLASLLMSPVRPLEFLLAKGLALFLIGLCNAVLAIMVGSWWFEIPLTGSLSLLLASTVCFILFCIGFGFLAARYSHSQFQAMATCLIGVFPMVFLSWGMTSLENSPRFLQALAWFNPLFYYVKLSRACFVLAQGWSQNAGYFLLLAAAAALISLLALRQAGNFFAQPRKAQ